MTNVMALLHERLTIESKWILAVLLDEDRFVPKEELWQLVNTRYQQKTSGSKTLIKSRHFLDNFMYRLEGAALVDVQKIGQVRLYEITPLGDAVLKYKVKGADEK